MWFKSAGYIILGLISSVSLHAAEPAKLRLSNTLSGSQFADSAGSQDSGTISQEVLPAAAADKDSQQRPEPPQADMHVTLVRPDVRLQSIQAVTATPVTDLTKAADRSVTQSQVFRRDVSQEYVQTTLNKPTGKFKFNVVTDNMVDSLNDIMQPTLGVGEMPANIFHQVIAAAVTRHPELRSVAEQAKVAGYASSEAFGAYLPQISASADVSSVLSRSETSSVASPKGDGVDVSLNLRQLLYDFGAISANYDAVKYRELAAKERFATKRSELSFRTISAYLELLRARLLYKHAGDNYASRLSIVNMVKERYELGGGSKVDVIRAEARLTDARAARVSAEINLQMALAGYKEMFNEEPADTRLPQNVSIELATQSVDELTKRFSVVRETEMSLKGVQIL